MSQVQREVITVNPGIATTVGSMNSFPLLMSIVLAVGYQVIGKLGQKSGSISCLMTLHLTSSVTRLVSGASDGSLSIWDPFPSGGGQSGSNSIPPSVVIKAHEGDIMGLELSHGPHEGAMSRIITIGMAGTYV